MTARIFVWQGLSSIRNIAVKKMDDIDDFLLLCTLITKK